MSTRSCGSPQPNPYYQCVSARHRVPNPHREGEQLRELCRYRHVVQDGMAPEKVETVREVRLGPPGAFADIRVTAGDNRPYFVEVKWGHAKDEFFNRLVRKYA